MERIPEPEMMDDAAQAEAYARADFADVNQGFTDRLRSLGGDEPPRLVLDVGCGPGDIPLRIARAWPAVRVVAVDGAAAMLALARRRLEGEPLRRRIDLVRARVPELPFPAGRFDALVSNSLVHHLPDPRPFWRALVSLGRPGAIVHVMDLFRPESPAAARAIVESAARDEDPLLKRDFHASLCAAFAPDEVRAQLPPGLDHLECRVVSERHWLVSGRLRAP